MTAASYGHHETHPGCGLLNWVEQPLHCIELLGRPQAAWDHYCTLVPGPSCHAFRKSLVVNPKIRWRKLLLTGRNILTDSTGDGWASCSSTRSKARIQGYAPVLMPHRTESVLHPSTDSARDDVGIF